MTQLQKMLLMITAFNLAIIQLFPPFIEHASHSSNAIFSGFIFLFSASTAGMQVYGELLFLEVIVVLINLGIFWLITTLNQRRPASEKIAIGKAAIWLIAFNLLGVLVFPPYEYVSSTAAAAIPNFEGFNFVLSNPANRIMALDIILYLEVSLILVNAGMMLLVFRRVADEEDGNRPMSKMPIMAAVH